MPKKRSVDEFAIWIAIACIAFAFYIVTAPSGLSWDLGGTDGGELATGVLLGGLVHSPGYPTYIIFTQISKILPLNSTSLQLIVFSSAAAALSTTIIAVVAWQKASHYKWVAAGITAIMLGSNELVWTQAIIVEVYALAGVFAALLIAMGHKLSKSPSNRIWLFTGLLVGIGLGSHYLIGFATLFILIYLFLRKKLHVRGICFLLAGILVGLLIFLWLPLRAGMVPLSNWGNPDTYERFWWVVSGAAFSDRLDLIIEPTEFLAILGILIRQATPAGLILITFGLQKAFKSDRAWLTASLFTISLNVWIVAGYDSADILPYLYPTWLLLALAAGMGCVALLQLLQSRVHDSRINETYIAIGIMLTVGVLLIARTLPTVNQATAEAEVFGRNIVQSLPANTVIISDDGRHTFAIRYAIANAQRFDIVPIDLSLLYYDWYRNDISHQLKIGNLENVLSGETIDVDWLLDAIPNGRPISTTLSQLPALVEFLPNPDGLTYSIVR